MDKKEYKLGLWEAVSIGVGTMIGAGIFSILGVGASIAENNLPIAFLLAGFVAFLIAYSYAKLGSKYISNAGPIEFIIRGIGDNYVTGTLSILMWFIYVISISLFAKAFAGYFLALFKLSLSPFNLGIVEVIVILFFTALNFFGSKAVGKAEFFIVLIKLSILGVFIVFGVWTINPEYIKPIVDTKHIFSTFFATSILFLTYTGFGLITNASENIKNPEKNVPLAIYIALAVVSVVYILISIVALGNLGSEALSKAQEYALAEAAKPFLGGIGFVLVAVGALFSTSSAINATLYGGANIAYALAKEGKLPKEFERKVWFSGNLGLYITSGLSIFFVVVFNLEEIASITSYFSLIIYLFVIVSHYKLSEKTNGNKPLIIFSLIVVLMVFLTLVIYQWKSEKVVFFSSLIVFMVAFIFELIYKSITHRRFKERNVKRLPKLKRE
jgi:amino acid transporter